MILGSACKFLIARGVVTAVDPYGTELGTVVFTNAETAERFGSAVRNCATVMADDEIEFNGYVEQVQP